VTDTQREILQAMKAGEAIVFSVKDNAMVLSRSLRTVRRPTLDAIVQENWVAADGPESGGAYVITETGRRALETHLDAEYFGSCGWPVEDG
jgi:hypothetical protein